MIDVVLGVDSSTQSCTVELREVGTGRLVSTGRAPHPQTFPPRSEQHPSDWWSALRGAIQQATAQHPYRIVAVGVGAQCHGLVALDGSGSVLRAAKLWNDTTSAPQSHSMIERFGIPWWIEQIGVVPSAALTVTKLAWLAEHEPEVLERTRKILLPHDWLVYALSGNLVTDRSEASGTGYYSAHTPAWREDILQQVVGERQWSEMFPAVLGPEGHAGTVSQAAADYLGIEAGAVVSAGGGDQHLAAVGIGLAPGDVAFSVGTSGIVSARAHAPVRDLSGAIEGVASATGDYLPIASSLNAAKVTDTMSRLLGIDPEELGRLAMSAPLHPDRPILAAFLDGERSPRMPSARGMLAGLGTASTRAEVALAAFEGVACGLLRGARSLERAGVPTHGRRIITGGGARSGAYRQILADLTQHPVLAVDAPEATARGAAIQASAVLHGETVESLSQAWEPPVRTVTEPQCDRQDIWDRYLSLAELQADGTTF